MNRKTIFFAIALILSIPLSACSQLVPIGSLPQQPRTISVNGNAQVILTPDIAYISIGVHTEAKDAAEAVASNNTQSQAVMDALTSMGIDSKDIRTTNFSIYPQEKWGPNGESLGTSFVVDNTVYVTLRNLDAIGDTLDAVVQAGANSVYGISFDVEDKESALADARIQAVANARSQAEALAAAAGIELGPVYSISYYGGYPTPVYDYKMTADAAYGGGSVPVSPGQMTLTVDVSVVYEIK
ncbi:MAG: SIMPL domain-containing protein [Anaerolineales bacterium]|nr:SIMPL domain-containing protein [Anaerolineales bacterium]